MPYARRIHIAAHGTMDIDSPVLSAIHLADGPLTADRILGLDLRGVELVTLSACESALVRFDELDDVHGIPTALLHAGVGVVIGALWPIAADVSEHFFAAIYTELAGSTDPYLAFHRAQTSTRAAHPAYRDWGSFVQYGF